MNQDRLTFNLTKQIIYGILYPLENLVKWLYRILRLFFCPHRWILVQKRELHRSGYYVYTLRINKCRYCGKEKTFKDRSDF